MELRAIDPEAFAAARALLASLHLPTEDLRDEAITLVGAFVDDALVGVIGLQACGEVALLRSLAVGPGHRDRGIAATLCGHVVSLARERGITTLYLLTETADHYFARLGFHVVDRALVPDAIRATTQFTSSCPSSARVMELRVRQFVLA